MCSRGSCGCHTMSLHIHGRMPRFSASSHAKRTSFHHSGVNAISPSLGLFLIFVAHGEQTSAMPKIVAAPMPVSLNQSRSLTIPSFETLLPIQCHHTPVFALCGGLRNTSSGSGAEFLPGTARHPTVTAAAKSAAPTANIFRLATFFISCTFHLARRRLLRHFAITSLNSALNFVSVGTSPR